MKMLKRSLVWILAVITLLGAMPLTSFALIDTSDNDYVITKKTPSGKTGKSMSISFTLKNSSGRDWNKMGISLSTDVIISDDEDLESTYVFPFEVNDNTFDIKEVGSLKDGSSKSVSISARVRRDIAEGYYSVPIKVYDDKNNELADEYINVWISKSTGSSSDDEEDDKTITFVLGEGQSTPDGVYPNILNFTMNLRNDSTISAQDVTVSMVMSKEDTEFPFEINDANYDRRFDKVTGGETVELPYSFMIRKDAYSGYYPIKLEITYRDSSEGPLLKAEESFFVRVTNKDKEDSKGDFNPNDRTKARLIVDSYETIPENIYAGEEFELILRMKNASADVPASNILFSLESEKVSESAVFSMESGSSSTVVNSMPAGGTAEIRVKMISKASIDQRSYSITVKEKYDSPEFKNAEESVVVDIPVLQHARLNTGTIEIMPESINVGSESNVMFAINNTGKVLLYNVMAKFEADSIQTTDAYVGNIKPGETGNVDVMISGIAPTADDGKVKITITYEDENGNETALEKDMTLFVTEEIPMDFDDSMAGNFDDIPAENPSFFSKYKLIILPAAALAVIAVIAVIVIKKKKKKAAQEEDEIDDEIS
ncbi:MAG: hypothetical protein KH366_13045 [Clostridiaceae bacterium]|nr:hypothetical protein [Clostridiaceae bacterium]